MTSQGDRALRYAGDGVIGVRHTADRAPAGRTGEAGELVFNIVSKGGSVFRSVCPRLLRKAAQVVIAVIAHLTGIQVRALPGMRHPRRAVAAVVFAYNNPVQQGIRQASHLTIRSIPRTVRARKHSVRVLPFTVVGRPNNI